MEKIPDVDEFVTELDLIDDLFGTAPKKLVMRTILKGGHLDGRGGGRQWRIPRLRSANPDEYQDNFATGAEWQREVPGDSLTLRISSFNNARETKIPLGPFTAGETVTIHVANLCAFNPLEWDDLPKHQVMRTDEEFKWIYQLLKPRTGSYPQLLKGSTLPAPRLLQDTSFTGDEDCMGAQITHTFTV
jgi:hypothetical protein